MAWFLIISIVQVNFKERQTRGFDSLPLMKLFMRLDTSEYTKLLESLVEKHNIADLDELRSQGKYKSGDLES